MGDLSVFTGFGGIGVGTLATKPTTPTPGQTEAATLLRTLPDGAVDIGIWDNAPGGFTADRSEAAELCHFFQAGS